MFIKIPKTIKGLIHNFHKVVTQLLTINQFRNFYKIFETTNNNKTI